MDNTTFKTNFLGKDGFVWWIGQIAPTEEWIENFGTNPKAWGMRYKVRIMGYHPYSIVELSDKDLPWAQVLTTPGNSGSLNTAETVRLAGGDVVIGFFLDGHNAQVPMIMGSFANTTQWQELKEKWKESGAPASPFGVFGGYSKEFNEANYAVNKSQDNSNGAESNLSNNDGLNTGYTSGGPESESYQYELTSTTGAEIDLCNKGPVSGIKSDVKTMISKVQGLKGILNADTEFYRDKVKSIVSSSSESITNHATKIASNMVGDTFKNIVPIAQTGLGVLYKGVSAKVTAATGNPAIGHVAGVAAQTAMVGPLNVAENLIGCLANNIIADLGESTEGILNSMVDNVFDVTDCVSDQVVGAITNDIIGKVGKGMDGALGGLDKILNFFSGGGFNVENIIRNSTSALAGAIGLRGCNEPIQTDDLGPCRYRLGYGPISAGDADLSAILKNANTAAAASTAAKLTGFPLDGIQDIVGAFDIFNSDMKVPGFKSALGECYSGFPTICEPPKIKIFGGGKGSGGEAVPIFGNITGEGKDRIGSVIDIKITNPGNDYQFPPFIEIVDNCKQGYGAKALSVIKDGKLTNIYMTSVGANYPVGDQPELSVIDVAILNPGIGYSDGDSVTDNFGNEYDVTIQNGSIVKIKPLTTTAIDGLVEFTINSSTGANADISATIDIRPEYQGEVKQVIDCIAPRTGNLVGYVKGEPYYGNFHVHPNTGKKMVGAAHTTTPHEIIYDTPEESL
tara:strand:+ start:2823 stop:5036 length:2214 start_codon:yes stop_codon:yes gene_type:complete